MNMIHPKLDVFKGLNNALSPCSYEYREGSAYVSDQSRVNESGLWAEQAALSACSSPAAQKASPFGNGSHVKNCAVEGVNQIITGIATTESIDVGSNRFLYTIADSSVNEVQTLSITGAPIGGTFTLTFDGQTTAGIAHNASAATIETAFEGLSTVGAGNGTCAGGALPTAVTITFTGDLAATNVSLVVVDTTNLTGGTDPAGTIVETTRGARGKVKYQDKEGNNGDCDTFTPPSGCSAANGGTEKGRLQNGTYYYMATYFDNDRKRESLPSTANSNEIDIGTNDYNRIMTPFATSAMRVRIYRSKRTSTAEGAYNAVNIFYFLTELTSGRTFTDYLHDSEIENDEYEGRGTAPPVGCDYLAAFNNRMLYFVGNTLYWSSSDRPEEVALEYTVRIDSVSVKSKPLLSVGVYGEAKLEISELSGQKVVGALAKGGRLWVWTSGLTGYLEPTGLEGFRFIVVRRGIGLVNDKVLTETPYGIFGADRQGIWLIDNTGRIKRLSDGVVDITTAGKSTVLSQAYITDSFGVWLPTLKEYWWSVQKSAGTISSITGDGTNVSVTTSAAHGLSANEMVRISGTTNYDTTNQLITVSSTTKFSYASTDTGATSTGTVSTYRQIVFQANRSLFAGPYNHCLIGGCDFVSAGGAQAFLNDGDSSLTGKDAMPPSSPAVAQELQFWFGQSSLANVKDNVDIEIIYESITADKTVTAVVYQNNIASTTGAAATESNSHTDDNLVGRVRPVGSGRMIMLKLTIPSDCEAPVIGTGYKANLLPWSGKGLR